MKLVQTGPEGLDSVSRAVSMSMDTSPIQHPHIPRDRGQHACKSHTLVTPLTQDMDISFMISINRFQQQVNSPVVS
jgi:hypothetical protein